MLDQSIFSYLIEYPAWFLGSLLGGLIYIATGLAALGGGIYIGVFIYKNIRIPGLNLAAAIIISLWFAGVVAMSLKYTGASIFREIDHRSDE